MNLEQAVNKRIVFSYRHCMGCVADVLARRYPCCVRNFAHLGACPTHPHLSSRLKLCFLRFELFHRRHLFRRCVCERSSSSLSSEDEASSTQSVSDTREFRRNSDSSMRQPLHKNTPRNPANGHQSTVGEHQVTDDCFPTPHACESVRLRRCSPNPASPPLLSPQILVGSRVSPSPSVFHMSAHSPRQFFPADSSVDSLLPSCSRTPTPMPTTPRMPVLSPANFTRRPADEVASRGRCHTRQKRDPAVHRIKPEQGYAAAVIAHEDGTQSEVQGSLESNTKL